jgi:hypothetical protein
MTPTQAAYKASKTPPFMIDQHSKLRFRFKKIMYLEVYTQNRVQVIINA